MNLSLKKDFREGILDPARRMDEMGRSGDYRWVVHRDGSQQAFRPNYPYGCSMPKEGEDKIKCKVEIIILRF